MIALDLRRELMEVARGERAADLLIRGATLANVLTGELHPANVAVYRGRFAYVGPRQTGLGPGTEVLDAAGLVLAPGLVEPHCHPFILYTPAAWVAGTLPLGVTAFFGDAAPWAGGGDAGLRRASAWAAAAPVFVRWLVRSGPATAGPAPLPAAAVAERLADPAAAAYMEVGRWVRQYRGESPFLEGMEAARRLGRRVEGHLPGVAAERLSALVLAGITADHEPTTPDEALARLRAGLWVMLRHNGLRPDLPDLAPLVAGGQVDTSRLMVTGDSATAAWIGRRGLLDEALRILVQAGVPPVRALQLATRNPAAYFGVEEEIGAVAPGRRADFVLYRDLAGFRPEQVYVQGRPAAAAALPPADWGACCGPLPLPPAALAGAAGIYAPERAAGPGMEFTATTITRRVDLAGPGLADGDVQAVLVSPDGRQVCRCTVRNLAPGLGGGFATTCHVGGGLLVLGRDPAAMARAALRVCELGGGMALAEGEAVRWEWALPWGGFMAAADFAAVAAAEAALTSLWQDRGYPFADIVHTLLFLTGDTLPRVRLTPAGLFDTMTERVLRPPEPV